MGIITESGYLKHSLTHTLKFCEIHNGTDVNYFDLMEDSLLTCDDVAYELVKYNKWSS